MHYLLNRLQEHSIGLYLSRTTGGTDSFKLFLVKKCLYIFDTSLPDQEEKKKEIFIF